jgi:WD40 repeat protein
MDVWDIDSGELLWSLSTADEPWKIIQASFSDDGEDLIVYLIYALDGDNTAPAELRVFGAHDGSLRRTIEAPDCSGIKFFPGPTTPFWDLSGQVIWTVDDDCDYFGTGQGEVGLLDLATGAFTPVLPIEALVSTGPGQPTIDASASRLAVSDLSGGGRVVDIASGEVLFEYPGGLATLSADGTRLLTGSVPGVSPVELWDIDESRLLWRFDAEFGGAGFSPDGTLAGGAQAGTIYILDAETGFERLQLRGHTSFAAPRVVSIDNSRLVSFGGDGMARVWDIGSQLVSEGATYAVHPRPSNHDGGSGVVAGGVAAIWTGGPMLGGNADWETVVIDLETGEILASVSGGSPALSSDGSLLAYRIADRVTLSEEELRGYAPAGEYRRIGDVRIIDVRTGDVVAEVAAPCHSYQTSTRTVPQEGCGTAEDDLEWAKRWKLALSPDESLLALTDGVDNSVTLLDVETGAVLLVDRSPDNNFAGNPVFSPDGAQLAADFGHLGGCEIRIYELDSYTMEAEIEMGSACTGAVDFSGDGRYLVGGDWLGNITYIDTDDWSLSPPVAAHQTSNFADLTSNPSGTLIVTAAEDAVRVWNVADQSLHTEIAGTAGPIRIATFIDDTHLLVVPQHSAEAIVIALDPADLIEVAKSRVTRAFRADECLTYDIDPCPTTLDELRGG